MRAHLRRPDRRVTPNPALAATLALATIALAACTSPAPSAGPSTASSALEVEANIRKAVASLDGMAASALARTGVPGLSIAVVHRGRTIYAQGFGVRKAGTDEKVDADTTFQVASVSKPIGASVVAQVVGAGEASWDDPVVRYLPAFALSDPYVTEHATIGDFYSMRTGLPGTVGDELELVGFDRQQIMAKLRLAPLGPFRAVYHYTNFGLTVGAEAAAKAAGVPWEQLSKERIYDPLGMTRTTSDYAEFLTQDNRATLHTRRNGVWGPNEVRDPRAQSPAGGVSTSANDMGKWMAMELASGLPVIAGGALQETRIPRIASNPSQDQAKPSKSSGYGIGIETDSTGRVRYSFSGAFTAGAATNFQLLPAEHLGISVFTNGAPIGVPEAITSEFLDIVEQGRSTQDWVAAMGAIFASLIPAAEAPEPPKGATPPLPAPAYTGTYANAWVGPATVTESGGSLVVTVGPDRVAFPLTPFDGSTFTSTDPATGQYAGMVAFTVAGAAATSMTMEGFDGYGLGTLARVPSAAPAP